MKKEAKRLIETYFNENTLEKIRQSFLSKDCYKVKFGNSDSDFHRGIYSPALLLDLHVSNIHRGEIFEKGSAKKYLNHIYFYNYKNEICLVERIAKSNNSRHITLVSREENKDFSITVPLTEGGDLITIAETHFKDNQIQKYEEIIFSLETKYDETETIEYWWTLNSLIGYIKQGGNLDSLIDDIIQFRIEEYQYKNNVLVRGIERFSDIIEADHFPCDKSFYDFQYVDGILSDEVLITSKETGIAGIFAKFMPRDNCYCLTHNQKQIIECINKKEYMFNWL